VADGCACSVLHMLQVAVIYCWLLLLSCWLVPRGVQRSEYTASVVCCALLSVVCSDSLLCAAWL
jgi:hypothetical protein